MPDPKDCIIQIDSEQFSFSKSQLVLISSKAFDHFAEVDSPFIIDISNMIDITIPDLISVFKSLITLLTTETQLIINDNNISSLTFLAKSLGNSYLLDQCSNFLSSEIKTFKLSSKNLVHLKENERFNNLHLIINEKRFEINSSLFCCISDKQKEKFQTSTLIFSIPEDYLNCFSAFLGIFKGEPFQYQEYDLSSQLFLIYTFELSSFARIISSSLANPQTVQEAIQFLKIRYCEILKDYFNQCSNFLVSHLEEVSIDEFLSLSNSVLENLFSASNLQIVNEDYLLELVLKLIEIDPNRRALLKTVMFTYVSSNLLQSKMNKFSLQDFDNETFEVLKKRMFSELLYDNSVQSNLRWKTPPLYHSKEEIQQLQDTIINKNQEIQELKRVIEDKDKIAALFQNLLKSGMIILFNGHNGIISALNSQKSGSVIVTEKNKCCESPDHLLVYNNERLCLSKTGSVCFNFLNKKICVSKYLLRSWNTYYPHSWKVEGSNDQDHWELIDRRANEKCLENNFVEKIFNCEINCIKLSDGSSISNAFSFIKFTPEDNQSDWSITYVDFEGIIFLI
ncbi:MAG: hypothetical protein LBC61_05190 [Candidatus Peribacteria bacterium]|nr:hypothetical protein [Candidatus Peribacteria bacterium]